MDWVSLCQWEASITDLLKTYVFLLYLAFPSLTTAIDSLLFKASGRLSAPSSPRFRGPIYGPGCCQSMEPQTTHSKVYSNPTRGWNVLEGGCTSFHLLPFYTPSPHICFPPSSGTDVSENEELWLGADLFIFGNRRDTEYCLLATVL
jgi:hypothetical protein